MVQTSNFCIYKNTDDLFLNKDLKTGRLQSCLQPNYPNLLKYICVVEKSQLRWNDFEWDFIRVTGLNITAMTVLTI